ncbi:MAG: SulP family inorganic anion transporter [Pirellulales bacterium]|nr:SulP family inorganic anion transporter [Pirellulales bacterium]
MCQTSLRWLQIAVSQGIFVSGNSPVSARFAAFGSVLFRLFDLRSSLSGSPRADILSGLTVALALVPEAVAFAFLAGVPPLVGLYAAFVMCLLTAVFGGRPGMISGATGAMGVVVVSLVADHGIGYLFPAVVLCGVLQVTVGLLRLGKLIRIVPHPVMLGFVNGLAVVILLAQIGSFQTLSASGQMEFLSGQRLWLMLGLVGLTMAIIALLPRLTKAVPSSLAAILAVTACAVVLNAGSSKEGEKGLAAPRTVLTVGDMLIDRTRAAAVTAAQHEKQADSLASATALLPEGFVAVHGHEETLPALTEAEIASARDSVDLDTVGIAGGLPRPAWWDYQMPPATLATLWIILPYSLILAGVGLIESLMTLTLVDELTETRGQANRECVGQGVANMVCGLFGGMGGCAMIGQSLINVKSGGRGRLSGITAAVMLLLFILFFAKSIEAIPMAALVGVMFMVVIGTFEWSTLQTWRRIPLAEVLVMLVVASYTVLMHDLATAVILGVAMSAVVFAWNKSKHLVSDISSNEFGSKIYQLHGVLFFGSTSRFRELFTPQDDPDDVVIDFYFSRVYDQSGLEAINALAERYERLGKRLHLRHLSDDCRRLLDRAGDLVEVNISEDPHYHVLTERSGRVTTTAAAGVDLTV